MTAKDDAESELINIIGAAVQEELDKDVSVDVVGTRPYVQFSEYFGERAAGAVLEKLLAAADASGVRHFVYRVPPDENGWTWLHTWLQRRNR